MKNRTINFAFLAVIAIAALAYVSTIKGKRPSAEIEKRFSAANSAVAAEDYQAAIDQYKKLIADGQRSPAVYHNLAVAQHQAGDLGQAILNYERAAISDPGANDIRANLGRARKDSATVREPESASLEFAKSFSANGWSVLGASGFVSLSLLALGRATRLLPWSKSATRLVAIAALLATAIPVLALTIQHKSNADRAIVTAEGTNLRVSPFEDAKALATLTPGRSLHILPDQGHGDYRLAQLETGQKGWVKTSEFEIPTIAAK